MHPDCLEHLAGPKHFIIKRLNGDGKACSNSPVTLYTRAEAERKAKQYAGSHRARYGVFQLVDAFEPTANVRRVDLDEVE